MKEFYEDFSFIIGFMILCLLVLMAFGEKSERGFLLTTLFGMVILNADSVMTFFSEKFKVKE